MKRYFSLIASAMLFLFLYTGCGASSGDAANAVPRQEAMEEMGAAADVNGSAAVRTPLPENRKWVITSNVHAETEELDQTVETVLTRVQELKGYVEDQNFDNGSYYGGGNDSRSARLTIRVPAESIDAFMDTVQDQTNVVSSSRNLQDITLQYTDTETRIAALKAEEARLLEFMEQAETMADLLEIEGRLTDVHYELENVSSRLRTYDNQVNYATIYLNIDEVREYTPVEEPTFWERITDGFAASLKGVWRSLVNLVVLLVVASPYLLVWGGIIALILLIVRGCRKKRKTKKTAPAGSQQIPESWKKFDSASEEETKQEDQK